MRRATLTLTVTLTLTLTLTLTPTLPLLLTLTLSLALTLRCGKRVDFSGRTVISPDPNLEIDEVRVPPLPLTPYP